MITPRDRLLTDAVEQVVRKRTELAVVECGVDGRDEVAALRQDRDAQRLLGRRAVSGRHRPS